MISEATFNAMARHRGWFCRIKFQTDGIFVTDTGFDVNLEAVDAVVLHMAWGDGSRSAVLVPLLSLLEPDAASDDKLDWGMLADLAAELRA